MKSMEFYNRVVERGNETIAELGRDPDDFNVSVLYDMFRDIEGSKIIDCDDDQKLEAFDMYLRFFLAA